MLGSTSNAQQLYFSNVPGISNKTYFNKVIGENEHGLFVLKFRDPEIRRHFVIEQYNHNLDFLSEQAYKISRKEELAKTFTTDTSLVFIIHNKKTGQRGLDLYTIQNNVKEIGTPIPLIKNENLEYSPNKFNIEYSLSRSHFAIFTEEISDKNQQLIGIYYFQTNGKLLFKRNMAIPEFWGDVHIKQAAISDNMEATCLVEVVDNNTFSFEKAKSKYMLLAADSTLSEIQGYYIQEKNLNISSPEIVYSSFSGKFLFCAFYSYKSNTGNQGLLNIEYKASSVSFAYPFYSLFERPIVKQLIGVKAADDGREMSNFYVRKLIPKSNGGFFVVAENYMVSTKFETIFVNGTTPQVAQSLVYNYGDILMLNYDSIGQLLWYKQIHKKQTSVAGESYYHSIGILVTDTCINILFNDDSQNDNKIMYVKTDYNGKIDMKMLLKSNSGFSAVVPFEGKQVGYNSLVLPLIQERNLSLLKILETPK